ncbi:PIN domain-containing protein [uncultured Brachyspira sp.]|uniref:PIN/TRAM domain-containing protein n=2 Tax=uncultured Brachyspira sp. TaxID=221953 RepID=UPI0025E61CD9|nr:PIN domain-containing protein [uncultured Brachyspira sp.]
MWRAAYFILSCIVLTADYFILKHFNYKTLTVFVISSVFIFLFEFLFIRKKSSKTALTFFISFFLTLITVLLTISTIDAVGISLPSNERLIILFAEGYLIFAIVIAFTPNISNMLKLTKPDKIKTSKILDTSVIVDGRIYDIAEKKFFDGLLILPEFVIKEVQFLSDSRDPQKRIRGRRALEILNKMKSSKNILLSITDVDFPNIKEVDLKLIELAKKMDAKVITNDFNLMKVASIHEVDILNINDLANCLHVVVLPGETINIDLIREGKDKQALGYLEDGTMIVVDNARHLIGKNVEIEIDNVLPKEAGMVIFASLSSTKSNNKKRYDNSNK